MALQTSGTFFDTDFPMLYSAIRTVTFTKNSAAVSVATYANKTSKSMGDAPITSSDYTFDIALEDTPNPIAQAYALLKTREEFNGAKDV